MAALIPLVVFVKLTLIGLLKVSVVGLWKNPPPQFVAAAEDHDQAIDSANSPEDRTAEIDPDEFADMKLMGDLADEIYNDDNDVDQGSFQQQWGPLPTIEDLRAKDRKTDTYKMLVPGSEVRADLQYNGEEGTWLRVYVGSVAPVFTRLKQADLETYRGSAAGQWAVILQHLGGVGYTVR